MIKCHFCKQKLEYLFDYEYNAIEKLWECPNTHATIRLNDNDQIVSYRLFWDVDPDAKERYKLVSSDAGTTLHYSLCPKGRKSFRSYQKIFETSSFITIPVRENTLQMDNLVMRLKKMGAFA